MGVAQMFAYDADADAGAVDVGAWHGQTTLTAAWPWAHWRPHSHSRTGTVAESCYPAADAVAVCVVASAPASDWPDAYPPVSMALRR